MRRPILWLTDHRNAGEGNTQDHQSHKKGTPMTSLIDFILNLFRDPVSAQSFVVNPEEALLDAGLSNVTSAQIQSVAVSTFHPGASTR